MADGSRWQISPVAEPQRSSNDEFRRALEIHTKKHAPAHGRSNPSSTLDDKRLTASRKFKSIGRRLLDRKVKEADVTTSAGNEFNPRMYLETWKRLKAIEVEKLAIHNKIRELLYSIEDLTEELPDEVIEAKQIFRGLPVNEKWSYLLLREAEFNLQHRPLPPLSLSRMADTNTEDTYEPATDKWQFPGDEYASLMIGDVPVRQPSRFILEKARVLKKLPFSVRHIQPSPLSPPPPKRTRRILAEQTAEEIQQNSDLLKHLSAEAEKSSNQDLERQIHEKERMEVIRSAQSKINELTEVLYKTIELEDSYVDLICEAETRKFISKFNALAGITWTAAAALGLGWAHYVAVDASSLLSFSPSSIYALGEQVLTGHASGVEAKVIRVVYFQNVIKDILRAEVPGVYRKTKNSINDRYGDDIRSKYDKYIRHEKLPVAGKIIHSFEPLTYGAYKYFSHGVGMHLLRGITSGYLRIMGPLGVYMGGEWMYEKYTARRTRKQQETAWKRINAVTTPPSTETSPAESVATSPAVLGSLRTAG
jgi:hypothetical protein